MRTLTVDTQASSGRSLCCSIFRPGGRKLLAKGHLLSDEDVRLLQTEGMNQVWVTELDEGEVSEDDAVRAVAGAMCCGANTTGSPTALYSGAGSRRAMAVFGRVAIALVIRIARARAAIK